MRLRNAIFAASLLLLAGCNFVATSGPSQSSVVAQKEEKPPIDVRDLDASLIQQLAQARKHTGFADLIAGGMEKGFVAGPGDTLQVTIWEAPPAMLFASRDISNSTKSGNTALMTSLPEQMVGADGMIKIPFAGDVKAAGNTLEQIEAEITQKLSGIANRPQVLARMAHNATSNVTVVGEVTQSLRMPLTAKGERLLDAIAAAGGVHQSVDKITLQISREGRVLSMPMDDVIRDPKQNIVLESGDVITALYQPLSFTVLGATGKNAEINFEAKGIMLSQALGRIGGLDDNRANAAGVFIFRFENPDLLPEQKDKKLPLTPDGKLPVIYRVDLSDPKSFLLAQDFPIFDKDVLYIANAPSAEFQKFMNIIYSAVFSAVNVKGL